LYSNGSLSIIKCEISSNEAKNGGGIFLLEDALITKIEDSTLSQNKAQKSGGGILSLNLKEGVQSNKIANPDSVKGNAPNDIIHCQWVD
jgi:hypothetical protein